MPHGLGLGFQEVALLLQMTCDESEVANVQRCAPWRSRSQPLRRKRACVLVDSQGHQSPWRAGKKDAKMDMRGLVGHFREPDFLLNQIIFLFLIKMKNKQILPPYET